MRPDWATGSTGRESNTGGAAGRPAWRHARTVVLASLVVVLAVLPAALAGAPAGATSSHASGVDVQAIVAGQPLRLSGSSHATKLDPHHVATVQVQVTNHGTAAISVHTVRLEGRVVDLSFFAYDTAVDIEVPPGSTQSLTFPLDLTGLDGQATGLIPGSLTVLDAHRHVLASQSFVADVRGSLWSVYGLFGLALLILTGLSFASLLLLLARHRLPANRWRRALRFLATGIGVGLVVTFFLSAIRVFVPRTGTWLLFAVLFAAGFFVIGYLSPAPDGPEDEDVDEGLTLEDDGTVTAPSGSGR